MKRINLLFLCFLVCLVLHFFNQHKILTYGRKITELKNQHKLQSNLNKELLTQLNAVTDKNRITGLAQEKLLMDYSIKFNSSQTFIGEKDDKQSFTYILFDFLTPKVQASTK